MKTVFQHIDHIKTKPHHVRKRVAFMAAASATALVALVWLVGSLSFGLFAIHGSTFADSTGEGAVIKADTTPDTSKLAGVAAAVSSASAPAHIEIVDSTPTRPSASQKKAEQTVIPF